MILRLIFLKQSREAYVTEDMTLGMFTHLRKWCRNSGGEIIYEAYACEDMHPLDGVLNFMHMAALCVCCWVWVLLFVSKGQIPLELGKPTWPRTEYIWWSYAWNLIWCLVLQRMHGPRRMLSLAPQLLPKGCAGQRLLQYSGSDTLAIIRLIYHQCFPLSPSTDS